MACMGAEMPRDDEIDSVTEEVLTLLKEKHRVHSELSHGLTAKSREKEKLQLREAVKELLFGRNCEEW